MMSEHSRTVHAAQLEAGEAHVWSVGLDACFHSAEPSLHALSDDDRVRADQHAPGLPRDRFIANRTALRHILARYVRARAGQVALRRETSGKLVMRDDVNVHFSLSHSGPLALIAVAALPVGIDIEHVREPRDFDRSARRILHDDTVRALAALPPHERAGAFIAAWTQREAHVKAIGGGLFRTPDALPFDIHSAADAEVRRLVDRSAHATWSVAHFTPAVGARAAVVVHGNITRLRHLTWTYPDNEETHE